MSVKINQFPNPKERETISNLGQFEKLYDLKHKAVLGLHEVITKQYKDKKNIVYLAHALPAMISDFYGDFVQGDEERLVISAGIGAKEKEITFVDDFVNMNDLIETVYDIGVGQSEFGFCVVHIFKVDEKTTKINLVPQDQFFPQKDGSVIIATYVRDYSEMGQPIYCLTQHYQKENGKVKIERQGFRAGDDFVMKEDVGIEKLNSLLGTKFEKEVRLEIDTIPFVVIPNGRRGKDGFGKSDYVDIMPQLAEINERATHISTQLLKNMDAKLVLPSAGTQVNKDGKVIDEDGNAREFDYILLEGKEHIQGYYLTNDNPLIEASERHIMLQIKFISAISKVPLNELLKSAMPERVEAMRIQLFGAIRKTNTKRAKVKKGLREVIKIAGKLNSIDLEFEPLIEMSDVLPTDEVQVVEAESVKVTSGLSSKRSAMKRLENYSDEEVDGELEQIKKEDLALGINAGNPPTV